jgi:hypothetical protein
VRSLSRLRRRSSLRRAAAALAAAAAVWSAAGFAFGLKGAGVWASIPVAVVFVAVYLALGARPWARLGSYAAGLVLTLPALYGAFIFALFVGCVGHAGSLAWWMWVVGLGTMAGGIAWSVRRPARAWWGIPLSTLLGFVAITLLAVAFTRGSGWCPE